MAKSKTPVAPATTPVAPATTPGPFAGLGAQPTAPAATAHAVMVAKAQANGMQATIAGATVKAAANIAARGANLQKVPAQIASTTYVLAKVPKVRATAASNYTVQGLAGWVAAGLGTVGNTATGQQFATASTGDFTSYAVRNGWLVKA